MSTILEIFLQLYYLFCLETVTRGVSRVDLVVQFVLTVGTNETTLSTLFFSQVTLLMLTKSGKSRQLTINDSMNTDMIKHQLYLFEQHSESFKIWSTNIRINTEGKSLIMKLYPAVSPLVCTHCKR